MLIYKVAAKYAKGPEKFLAQFNSLGEAKNYIQQKLQDDRLHKVNVTYLLYDLGEVMESFDQSNVEDSGDSSGSGGGGQQPTGGAQRFSPSPLQTNPRPAGMPASSFKDVDDQKK